MSVRIMSKVWTNSQRKDGELLVMLALADFANDAGESWPSIPILAQKARLTERQTRRVLTKLEAVGEIRRVRSNGGRNRRNHYFITVSENPDIVTGKKLQGKNNPDIGDTKTLTPMSGALNRHRTVNSTRRKERDRADVEPRVKPLIAAWHTKYLSRTSMRARITEIEGHCFKGLLKDGFDVAEVEAAMDIYFANEFYSKTGFDVRTFAKNFNKIRSAGVRKRHNYEDGAFPEL